MNCNPTLAVATARAITVFLFGALNRSESDQRIGIDLVTCR